MHVAYVSCWATGLQRSGSVGRALDWGSMGGLFEPPCRWSPCGVSLIKTLYPLLSTGSTKENPSRHVCKIVDRDVKNQTKNGQILNLH